MDKFFEDINDNLSYVSGKINSANDYLDKDPGGQLASRAMGALNKNVQDSPSIIARTRNSTLQFPIYITKSIRINEAQTIGSYFERVYVTKVQQLIAMFPIINIEDANGLKFLKKFHTNMTDAPVNESYEPIDASDRMIMESTRMKYDMGRYEVEFVADTSVKELAYIVQENARLMHPPLHGFKYLEYQENDLKEVNKTNTLTAEFGGEEVPFHHVVGNIIDAKTKQKIDVQSPDELAQLISDRHNAVRYGFGEQPLTYTMTYRTPTETELNDAIASMGIDQYDANGNDNPQYAIQRQRLKDEKIPEYKFFRKNFKKIENEKNFKKIDGPTILRDGDIKKFNGMLPFTINATFRLKSKDGKVVGDAAFIIGIKAVLHLIDVKDIGEDIEEIINGNNKSLRKIKYTTGEISTIDYLFDITNIKKNAVRAMNNNRRWLANLKELGNYKKLRGTVFSGNAKSLPIPNGTLVLTQSDIVRIKDDSGIDLSKVSNAKKLASALFLISVVIVDAVAGTMKVLLVDESGDWDTQSIGSIDADVQRQDNSKIASELGKIMNR